MSNAYSEKIQCVFKKYSSCTYKIIKLYPENVSHVLKNIKHVLEKWLTCVPKHVQRRIL